MPDGLGETLTTQYGPLPVWAWTGLGVAGLAGYLVYRKKKQAAAQQQQAQNSQGLNSNLGTVPISNLTTQAQPMPLQLGDTFVNVPGGQSPVMQSTGNPVTTVIGQQPGASSLTPGGQPAPTPATPQPSPQASGGVVTGG